MSPTGSQRIPSLPVEAWSDDVREVYAVYEGEEGRINGSKYNFTHWFANHPSLALNWMRFTVAEARDDQILSILHTNLAGPIFACRAAIPLMAAGSQIVNLSSESVARTFPMLSLYQSSKAGLERFSASLADELRGQGIRVTTLRAGMMYDEDKTSSGWDPAVAARFGRACLDAGLDLRSQPKSHFDGIASVIATVLRLPADVGAPILQLEGFPRLADPVPA